jgi:hypothetical protein
VEQQSPPQFVDPPVSRAKFDREVADYRVHERDYRRRGWILLEASFPKVLVAMAAPQLTPPAIVTGVLINYTNYDAEPPSVRLVDPFTEEPFAPDSLPTVLKRGVPVHAGNGLIPPGVPLPPGAQMMVEQPLMQSYDDSIPFLCLAGVREYHAHPAHSGDSWELHRSAGAGRLVRLLEIIDTYGVKPITEYGVQLVPQIAGFRQGQPPA